MHILIIEDEYALAELIKEKLTKEGYIVDIETDGKEGYYNALSGLYDLIILDVMLPSMNGFEILKKLREEEIESKVIMLTAKSMLEDKLNGLENGANDYLTKPFHIEELSARVNVQLNKTSTSKKKKISYEDIELDVTKSVLKNTNNNEEVELVCKELKLLEYFINNKEQILSKDQIYNKVWGIENEIESNNLEAYLSFIRRKLKAINSKVNIKSIRGLGYKMEVNND